MTVAIALAVAAGSPRLAMAQQAAPVLLPPVNTEAPAPAPEAGRLDYVAPSVTIDRAQFTLQPSDRASDIVGRMPGVVISGPPGEKKAFSLRGLTSDFNRVEVDGVRPPSSGQSRVFELMNVPGDQLQKVEIRRTPTARDEADGIAGVIAVETRGVPAQPTLDVTVAGGLETATDQLGSRASVYAGRRFSEGFGGVVAVNRDQRTIAKVKDMSERTYSGGPGGQGFLRDEEEPKDFTNTDGYALGEYSYGSGEIRVRPSFLVERTELDKWRDQYRRVTGQYQDRTLTNATEDTKTFSLSLQNEHRFDHGITLKSQLVVARTTFDSTSDEQTLNASLTFTSGSRESSAIRDTLYQIGQDLMVPVSLAGASHKLGFGYLAKRSDRTSDREVFTLDAAGTASQSAANLETSRESDYAIDETYLAAYVMDEITIGSVTIAPGLRIENLRDDMSGGRGSADTERSDLLPSLPLTWRITEALAFQGGIARTVNRPKFDEIAPGITRRGQRSFIGNPDLKPATAWGYDAGMSWTAADLFLGINAFHRDIKDVIESAETSTNTYEFRNVGDGWARGVELEQRFAIGHLAGIPALAPLSLGANQTFVKTEVDDPMTGKRPFADQAEFFANFQLSWDDAATGTRLALLANYTGDRTTISYEGSGAVRDKTRKAEWTFDLRAEQRLAPGWSVFLSGENLTDQERDEVEYVNGTLNRTATIASGRTIYLGTALRF
ncbi:MAG: hypothetical protein OHK0024_16220 [Thalassobaculales bacterium]